MKNYINIIHIAVIQHLNDCHDTFFFAHLQIKSALSMLNALNQFMYFALFSFPSMLSLFLSQMTVYQETSYVVVFSI